MSKLTFFKGALIASVLSVVFWVGAAVVIVNMEHDIPQQEIQKEEMEENTYAML